MRPEFLEIEGLQSFRDAQKIDFEVLSETGLFGIFGPTGSGKSTVLDAITFALYGRIKRAESGTQGIINTGSKTVRVAFTFSLSKDGGRRTYRVERVYQRKKGSANSCEPKIARLLEVTEAGDIPVCDKATDVTNTVQELLGLSEKDFTRAVVLPQNSFQEFIQLSNKDRREMLERIFYLEEYGKQLWDKLGRKMSKLGSQIDQLAGELKGYEDASDEALKEAGKSMGEAAAEMDGALKKLKLLEAQFKEAQEVWALVQELSIVTEKEKKYISEKQEIDEKRVGLERAQKANELIGLIVRTRELGEKLGRTEDELAPVEAGLPDVRADLEEHQKGYESLRREIEIEQPRLLGIKARLDDALGIKKEISGLTGKIKELQTGLDRLKDKISEKNSMLKNAAAEQEKLEQDIARQKSEAESMRISPAYRQQIQDGAGLEIQVEILIKNAEELQKNKNTLSLKVAGLSEKLKTVHGKTEAAQSSLNVLSREMEGHFKSAPGDKTSVQKKLDKLHEIQTAYNILCFRKNEMDTLRCRLSKQKDEIAGAEQKLRLLGEDREKALKTYEDCKRELEEANAGLDSSIAHKLAMTLREGEPCPVCGSQHHPGPAVFENASDKAVLEQKLEQADEKLAGAEKAFQDADRAVLLMNERLKSSTEQYGLTERDLSRKEKEYEAERSKLPDALKAFEHDELGREIGRMGKTASEKLQAIEKWESEQEAFKEKIQKLGDELNHCRIEENGILAELRVNSGSLETAEKSLSEATEQSGRARQKHLEFLNKFHIKSAASESKRLSELDRKRSALEERTGSLEKALAQKRAGNEKLREELRSLDSESVRTGTELQQFITQKESNLSKLRELAGDSPVEEEIRRINGKLSEYARLEKDYREKIKSLEKRVNGLENQKALLLNQRDIFSENLKKEEAGLNAALAGKGFRDKEEVEASQLSPESIKALKGDIERYDQEWLNIRAQKDMLRHKLHSRSITEEEWEQISRAYQEIAAYKEECVSRNEVAKSNFEDKKKKHEKWLQLSKSYRESTHRQELYDSIQKILRAEHRKDNSFIDYIAEERLRYVAAKASEILGAMTKYKYGLELGTDASFIVRDYANGGVCRMVSTLSGGETFLTSLSLALALSEQIQLRGQSPLEFFFLDEGFGTLDNNLLDTVIDSLERLSRKERVIGIISHVPELRSRIGRRLIVDPPTVSGEGSRVRIEKA